MSHLPSSRVSLQSFMVPKLKLIEIMILPSPCISMCLLGNLNQGCYDNNPFSCVIQHGRSILFPSFFCFQSRILYSSSQHLSITSLSRVHEFSVLISIRFGININLSQFSSVRSQRLTQNDMQLMKCNSYLLRSARLGWSLNPPCNWFMSMQIHVHVHVGTHVCNVMPSICLQGSNPCSDTTTVTPYPECHTRSTRSRTL